MQIKFPRSLPLLVTGVFFIAACSKQESTPRVDQPSQTASRTALKFKKSTPVMDLPGKDWSIIRTETADIPDPKKAAENSDITTITYYNEGEYTVHFDRYGSEPSFAKGYRFGLPTHHKRELFDYSLSSLGNTMVMYDEHPGIFQFTVLEVERVGLGGLRLIGTTNNIHGDKNYQKLVWDLVPLIPNKNEL